MGGAACEEGADVASFALFLVGGGGVGSCAPEGFWEAEESAVVRQTILVDEIRVVVDFNRLKSTNNRLMVD